MPSPTTQTPLQSKWTTLYRTTLPSLAKQRSPAQSHWPVHLDHCFARIILDNAIGEGTEPWTSILKAPAVRNMSVAQLRAAIKLGEEIANGEADLVELDRISLMARGKEGMVERKGKSKGGNASAENKGEAGLEKKGEETKTKKRKIEADDKGTISKYFLPSPKKPRKSPTPKEETTKTDIKLEPTPSNSSSTTSPDPLALLATSNLTPFRKTVLSLLCAIPPGQYTTYGALSAHITSVSPKPTCARAVGNALRNNPFAPAVPCHRVLASDGRIGGFGGDWGEEGRFAGEKVRLLREEGVRFDGKGKVLGEVWRGWERG